MKHGWLGDCHQLPPIFSERCVWSPPGSRYEEALRNYVPPSDLDELEDEDAPKKRAKKDADAPKRPRTAYILFSIDYR